MKKRTMLSFFCVSVLVLILGACNGKEGTKNNSKSKEVEQVATFSAMTPVQSLDPATAVDQTSITLLANVMEGLYRLDEKNQPQPAIAAGQPKISNNGKTYTIVIRDGAKWADGTDITADDFVTEWQRVVDPKTASPSVELFSAIKNAKEIASGKQSKETLAVKSNGNKTIEIELEKPTPYFTDLLALTAYYPVQQKAIKEYGKDYGTSQKSIVTNGAFNLTSLEGVGTSDKWTISKNKEYWDQKEVSMEKINFQVVKEINTGINLYNDGQLDDTPVTGEYAKQYKDNKEFSTTLMANTMYLELNQREKNSILKNKNVRKAISYAIDRSNYAKNILDNGSISAVGVVAKDVAFDPSTKKDFANKMLVHFDTEKAQSYWNKAKKELNIKEQVTLNLLTNEEETTKKAAEYIQGQLEENLKGLKITITPVPANVQIERVMKHDFTISLKKRSALRRELKPRPQHKAPNAIEKAQEGLRQAHEKGRMQEQKSEEQLKRQQHESARQKEYEKDRLKKQESLKKINDQSDESTNLTALRNQNRRTGQRSKKRETGHQTLMKRQGEKVLQPTNKPKDMKKQVVARSPRRTGQPTTRQNIQPKVAAQTVKRSGGTLGSNPAYRRPEVRKKMDQVKQVTQVDVPQTHSTPQRVQPKVNEPITRMNRHNTPIIKKEKRTKQSPVVRRERKKPGTQKITNKPKGVRQPRARK